MSGTRSGPLEPPENLPDADADGLDNAKRFLEDQSANVQPSRTPLPPPRPEPKKNNVLHDSFDERLFTELYEASEEIANLSTDPAAPPTFAHLVSDLFYAFYKVRPTLADRVEMERGYRIVNRAFVERLLEDDQTLIVRLSTCLDDMASALAALEAARRILDEISRRPDLSDWIQQCLQPDPQPDDEDPDVDHPPDDGSLDDSIPPPPARDLRRAVSEALGEARDEAESFRAAGEAWGFSAGDLKRVPLGERLEVARRLKSPRMASFADLLGRMRNVASGAATKKVHAPSGELHSITRGSDLQRVLPHETARGLASGLAPGLGPYARTLQLDFHRRRAEGALLSYQLTRDDGSQRRGPIVAMIDASPSMAGPPMDWAVALAAALAQGPAARDGRSVYLIYFNTRVVTEIELSPKERDPRKLLSAATVGTSGGTDFDAPIARALEIVRGGEEHRAADLLIVTDGQCSLSETGRTRLLEGKRELSFSLYAVLCGDYADASDLSGYCEAIWHAEKDLASPTGGGNRLAGEILRGI